jgi:hypothetical protein
MFKFVLSAMLAVGLALPVMAGESRCVTDQRGPSMEYVTWATESYPEFNQTQVSSIATGFQAASQATIAVSAATNEIDRQFAERLETLTYKALAFQVIVFQTLPEVEAVLEQMRAEKSTGLTQVSPELLPRVQTLGLKISDNWLIWGEILVETSALTADRYQALDDTKNLTERAEDMKAIDPSLCMVKKGLDIFVRLTKITVDIIPMAYVGRITYN